MHRTRGTNLGIVTDLKKLDFMLYDYVFHILYRLYKIPRISYLGHSSRKPVSGMRVGEGMSRRTWQGETKRVQGYRSVVKK